MYIPELVISVVLVISLLTAVGLLSSRSLAEYMVRRGLLPHMFLEMIPAFVVGARLIAAAMILIGLGRAAVMAGLLSGEWMGRYGLAFLMVIVGVILFWMTFRERRQP